MLPRCRTDDREREIRKQGSESFELQKVFRTTVSF